MTGLRALFAGLLVCAAQTCLAQDAAQRCHTLAAHPDDPASTVSGVADVSIDIVAALRACEQAVEDHPDDPLLQFELARVYWESDQDALAIEYFEEAALVGDHPAAYAYLGIAYEYGYATGEPDPDLARSFYEIALAGGFDAAQTLLDALADARPMDPGDDADTFDFAEYKQPDILRDVYARNFAGLNDKPLQVLLYLKGMHDFFSKELTFEDMSCAHLHDARLLQKVVRKVFGTGAGQEQVDIDGLISRMISEVQTGGSGSAVTDLITGAMEISILQDEGRRDASRLALGPTCSSDVVRRLYKNAQYYFLSELV